MTFGRLITFLTLATIASTQYSPDSYQPLPSKVLQVPEYLAELAGHPEISLHLQIPKETAPIPFDTYAVPASDLRAPDSYEQPSQNFYDVPVPSQDLELPTQEKWNPDNDPTLYYELPVEITKETVPTNLHPKKYNKQVYEKVKPVATKPKEELFLVPVTEEELNLRRKQQQKAIVNYGKAENQKLVKEEKVKQGADAVAEASGFGDEGFGAASSAHGQRMQFEMHGHAGPKSYKWGYDTGAGKNRQFRYEERDKDGHVKGHYGYYDKHGKLQTVHYDAHPHDGFHAESS